MLIHAPLILVQIYSLRWEQSIDCIDNDDLVHFDQMKMMDACKIYPMQEHVEQDDRFSTKLLDEHVRKDNEVILTDNARLFDPF